MYIYPLKNKSIAPNYPPPTCAAIYPPSLSSLYLLSMHKRSNLLASTRVKTEGRAMRERKRTHEGLLIDAGL